MGLVGALSDAVNVPENGLRLLLSIIACYPIATIYRNFIYNKSAQIQCWFITLVGLSLYWFSYGEFDRLTTSLLLSS